MNQKPKKIYLYLGVGLPLGFLLLFLILNLIGKFITPPTNDVIFVQKNYGLEVSIKNNNINIQKKKGTNVNTLPDIVRFNPTTKKTIKYKVVIQKQKDAISYPVPDFPQNLKINPSKTSKDGYSFVCSKNNYFLFRNNQDNNCVLHKWVKKYSHKRK